MTFWKGIDFMNINTKTCDNKSVGILAWWDGKLLLIERAKYPFGFAPPAGHVDNLNSFEEAAREELKEEVGLNILNIKLIWEGRKKNKCRRKGGSWHYWKIYKVKTSGDIKRSLDETKQVGWYTKKEIKKLADMTSRYLKRNINDEEWKKNPGLEPVWLERVN